MPRDRKPTVSIRNNNQLPSFACDHCNEISDPGTEHSIIIVTYHVHQDNANTQSWSVGQHPTQGYACCSDHAIEVAYNHFDEYLVDPDNGDIARSVPSAPMPLHCSLDGCTEKMHSDWYQVAASYNHRGDPSLPSQSYWELLPGKQMLWFCSMDHARAGFDSIMEILGDMTVVNPEEDPGGPKPANRRDIARH